MNELSHTSGAPAPDEGPAPRSYAPLKALTAADPADRRRAAETLTRAAGDLPRDLLIASLDAVRRRLDLPDPEENRAVRVALYVAGKQLAMARILRFGSLIPRADEDPTASEIGHIFIAADLSADREVLRVVLDHCTPGQVAAFAFQWTTSEVCNGGFHQYFYNSTGVLCCEASAGCRLIGADDLAAIIEAACDRFPDGTDLGDREARIEALEGEDLSFDDLDRQLYRRLPRARGLMEAYIRDHPEEFFEA